MSQQAYESVTSPGSAHERRPEAIRLVHADSPSATELGRAVDIVLAEIRETATSYASTRARVGEERADDVSHLWEALATQIGGKLLRPRLTATAYLGLGGRDTSALVPVAAAIEVLHTAMLIHDDLIDHDDVRRGRPNIAGLYRSGAVSEASPEAADAAALLGGDLAMWSAVDLVLDAGLEPGIQTQVLRLLVRSVHTTVGGELLDVLGQFRAPGDVDAQSVARLKTAVYSCVVPLVAGAYLAGADQNACDHVERYGESAGVAFQLVDDLLGTFGDPAVTGKSSLSDLREGKRTELIAIAWRRADGEQSAVLQECLGNPDLDDAGAERVRRVLHETGAVETVRATVRSLATNAASALTDDLPRGLRLQLSGLLERLVERTV